MVEREAHVSTLNPGAHATFARPRFLFVIKRVRAAESRRGVENSFAFSIPFVRLSPSTADSAI